MGKPKGPNPESNVAGDSHLSQGLRQKETCSAKKSSAEAGRIAKYAEHDDQEAIMRLSPIWLQQFDPKEKMNHFFYEVLPILTLRVNQDHLVPTSMPQEPALKAPKDRGLEKFKSLDFDVQKALLDYDSAPMQYLGRLFRFVSLERARIMFDKLWARCPEFYLLGLAYHQLSDSKLDESGQGYRAERTDRLLEETLQSISDRRQRTLTEAQGENAGSSKGVELNGDGKKFDEFLQNLRIDIDSMIEKQRKEVAPTLLRSGI
jgi:hypothetical protein